MSGTRMLACLAAAIAFIGGIASAVGVPVTSRPGGIDTKTASPVTSLSSEELERLPGARDFKTILDFHNQLRTEVGAAPLRWSPQLAADAAAYAPVLSRIGSLQHAPRAGRATERENLLQSLPGTPVEQMMQVWGNERRLFMPGIFPNVSRDGNWASVAHYTQMIWPTTTEVGCGIANDSRFSWLVCRYAPGGNKDGRAVGLGAASPTQQHAQRLCETRGGGTILCDEGPKLPKTGGGTAVPKTSGGTPVQDGGGGPGGDTTTKEVACAVGVDVHKPISVDPDEPAIEQGKKLTPGATTLRNDDSDWHLGSEPRTSELPVVALKTDLERDNNPDENDLVKVDAANGKGLPNVYLFAFPTDAEPNIALGTQVVPVGDGRQASAKELGYYTDATKGGVAPGLPLAVGAAGASFWTEGRLGGKYRLVIGQLVPGITAAQVRYNRVSGRAYYLNGKTEVPAFVCEDQATLTVAVVDIFQQKQSTRLTAFDVYWGGRPHFRAEVWPGGLHYAWGAKYRLGRAEHDMPGTAVNGEKVATMERDAEDASPDPNAYLDGPKVAASGNAPGGFAVKGRIEGGFQINHPQEGAVPIVNTDPDNRYPERVSLRYDVNGEHLVRAEYLEVILPKIRAPAAQGPTAGTYMGAASQVQYVIVDAFNRVIKAANIADYLYLYGAGLKAWEALDGQPNKVIETGKFNDVVFLTNTGVVGGQQRPPLPLGTAQRSQATVLEDRMTKGTFRDTLIFTAPQNQDDRQALWRAARGLDGTAAQTARNVAGVKQEAIDRNGKVHKELDVTADDQPRFTKANILAIPQDVILQLRVGRIRYDVMVFQGNTLSIFAPYFFENMGDTTEEPFKYHVQFQPGTATSQLVPPSHRRPAAPQPPAR